MLRSDLLFNETKRTKAKHVSQIEQISEANSSELDLVMYQISIDS